MSKYSLVSVVALSSLMQFGCATSDDPGPAIGRAVVNTTVAATAILLNAPGVRFCEDSYPDHPAPDGCVSKRGESKSADGATIKVTPPAIKPAAVPKFDDLETYKAKRDAEAVKSE